MLILPLLVALASASPAPISPRLLHPKQAAPVRAAVRFTEKASPANLEALRRAGARPVELAAGGYAVVGRIVSVDVLQDDLPRVAAVAGVRSIEPIIPPVRIAPLDVTASKVGGPFAWSPPDDSARFTGKGIVVADHEFGWDIYHPDFFFLDGGHYDFEDRDGDGRASAGDGVDLDGDGSFESTLSVLEGTTEDRYTGERLFQPGYQPDVDWLYVDLDGNRVRSAGPAFGEDVPGLGEPMFVGDDVDQNGALDRHERLLRLGTSKIRAVMVQDVLYRRGQNLTQYPASSFDLSHGTGAIGIVSAGAAGLRRYTGIAPDAELVLITSSDPIVGLATAMTLGAHISFYEWNSPADLQDGAAPFETALADAAAAGMVQLAAAGNLANADHVMELLELNGQRQVQLTTDDFGFFSYRTFWLNLHWNAPLSALSVKIHGSISGTLETTEPQSQALVDGIELAAWKEESAHGNGRVLIVGSSPDGSPIPQTVLTLEVSTASTASIAVGRVRGVLFDDQSGWGKGVSWLSDRTDAGSALMPSTADTVIAVGAYGGRHDLDDFGWGAIDERRAYSGMGPRIDGARIVDVAAPDDPFSPAFSSDPNVFYASFGGTSGALPHAAGAAAVLLSSGVPYSHAAVEALLTEQARSDDFTGAVPNEGYGFGKVDLGRAIFGESFTDPPPPRIALTGPVAAVVGRQLAISAQISQPGGNSGDVLVAWDLGYDGIEEQPLRTALRFTTTPDAPGPIRVLARAKNVVTGRFARALYAVDAVEDCATAGCTTGCCRSDGLCGECMEPVDGGVAGPRDSGVIVVVPDPDRKKGCSCSSLRAPGAERASVLWLLLLFSVALLRRARGGSPRC